MTTSRRSAHSTLQSETTASTQKFALLLMNDQLLVVIDTVGIHFESVDPCTCRFSVSFQKVYASVLCCA